MCKKEHCDNCEYNYSCTPGLPPCGSMWESCISDNYSDYKPRNKINPMLISKIILTMTLVVIITIAVKCF